MKTKTTFSKILSWVLTFAIALTLSPVMPLPAQAAEFTGDGWSFNSNTATLTLTTNDGTTAWRDNTSPYYPFPDFTWEDVETVVIEDGVTIIGDMAFGGCINLSTLTFPEGITTIGISAFANCKKLTSLTLPEGVITIGNAAFADCDMLSSVILPESLVTVGQSAFANSKELTDITIPKNVTGLGSWAFEGCIKLESITFAVEIPPLLGSAVFSGATALATMYIPYGTTAAYQTELLLSGNPTTFSLIEGNPPITYTVTFDSKGGSAVDDKVVISGKTLTPPPLPTYGSQHFAGWYKDADYTERWNFVTDVIIDDITLYAKWEDFSPEELLRQAAAAGNEPNNAYKLYHNFNGTLDNEPILTQQLTIGKDFTLDLNGHTLKIDLPDSNPGGQNSSGIKITSGVTLTITDSSIGETGRLEVVNNADDVGTLGAGAAINTTNGILVINGGTIIATGGGRGAGIGGGWFAAGGTISITGRTVTATGGMYAAGIGDGSDYYPWAGDANNITISGGTVTATAGSGTDARAIGASNNSSDSAVTINGGFDYWAGSAATPITGEPTGRQVFNNDSTTFAATYGFRYIKLEEVPTFTVTFDLQDGSDVTCVSVFQNHTITAPTPPTKAGHTFSGWFTDGDLTQEWNFDVDIVTEDISLYAKWTVGFFGDGWVFDSTTGTLTVSTNAATTAWRTGRGAGDENFQITDVTT
ncbi:MAG: leucine-rich repeat protein, partial [Oscillospiraceae bacterium]|nr:leucine-rich repeat protein [Oscillospiraceae bacterium]